MKLPLKGMGPMGISLLVGQAFLAGREHWGLLTTAERHRLAEIVRHSKGRPGSLTASERRDLSALVRKLELGGLGRRLAGIASPFGGGRRR